MPRPGAKAHIKRIQHGCLLTLYSTARFCGTIYPVPKLLPLSFFADDTPSLATLIPSICSIVSLPFSILSISLRKELYSNSLMCCYRHVTLNYSVVLCLGFFFSPFNPSIFTVSLTLALSAVSGTGIGER